MGAAVTDDSRLRWMRAPVWLLVIPLLACGGQDADAFRRGGAVSGGGGSGGQALGTGGTAAQTGGQPGAGGTSLGTGGVQQPSGALAECGDGNPAGLDATAVEQLRGAPDGGLRLLYPYAGTVFPRGLSAPLWMWEAGPAAQAVYVHARSGRFEYEGCLSPTADGQLQMPQHAWEALGMHAEGEADPYAVTLALWDGTQVSAATTTHIAIAQASLKGSIYYNSYVSQLVSQGGFGGSGAILRIPPGGEAEVLIENQGCHGCHSVSADGSRVVARDIASYALSDLAPPNPRFGQPMGATFVGMYPDGSVYLTNANGAAPGVGPQAKEGPSAASLFETDTGALITNTGIPEGALMPTFSADGRLLVFNDFALSQAHGLRLMDFDITSRRASNPRVVFEDATQYPAWPFLLPDNDAVVFALTESKQFTGEGAMVASALLNPILPGFPINDVVRGPRSDLYLANADGSASLPLSRAGGFDDAQAFADDRSYLPFGADAEAHHNYYPTVSPVAAGGYFWVFFDSIRHYGNKGLSRQLWGSAVRISPDGHYATDPSRPAFYLPGQEWGTGNHRAFTALDPCKAEGASCAAGIDCCGGFCTDGVCEVPDAPRCAMTDESCATAADCCNVTEDCISGYCAGFGPQ